MTDDRNLPRRFASIFAKDSSVASLPEDTVLFENEHFVAVPSLGSLVAGWLLIIAKREVLSCRELNDEELTNLEALTCTASAALNRFPGKIYIFEHGAENAGSVVGCGVDQAHLHMVPLDFDLIEAAMEKKDVRWTSYHANNSPNLIGYASNEYILIYDVLEKRGVIGYPQIAVSQWVRRIIAEKLCCERDWDYRVSPNHKIIEQTIAALI